MATETEDKKDADEKVDETSSDASAPDAPPKDEMLVAGRADASVEDAPSVGAAAEERAAAEEEVREAAPMQLGTRRFVYAAYFAGAIGVAFLLSKIGNLIWQRLESYKPEVGDPRDDLIMPIAAVIGAGVAFYYWRKLSARQYAEEVAAELAQVTWPSRQEVTNSTTVVIVATAFATIFFALMDRFWAFVTDLVYRF
jgi:preprotein translocase subunit SecE